MARLEEPLAILVRPTLEAASIARRFAADATAGVLDEIRHEHLQLLVSELVTNAAIHAGTACLLMLCLEGDMVRVEVDDESPRAPRITAQANENGGWGLRIVDQLAHQWGIEQRAHGKRLWFLI